jgi:hypothetical protein
MRAAAGSHPDLLHAELDPHATADVLAASRVMRSNSHRQRRRRHGAEIADRALNGREFDPLPRIAAARRHDERIAADIGCRAIPCSP